MAQVSSANLPRRNLWGPITEAKVELTGPSATVPQTTIMASTTSSKEFLQVIQNRRTIYELSKKPILADDALVQYIRELVKEAPSSFNVQSSRVVVLLGDQHNKYWNEIVPRAVSASVSDEALETMRPKLQNFAKAYGTILFFEDEKLIKAQQEQFPMFASGFPTWSLHASGMAQIYTWSGLEAAGYGANLQHYGNLTGDMLKKEYSLPESFQIQSEMVFGYPEGLAQEKEYNPDHERVIAYGHSA